MHGYVYIRVSEEGRYRLEHRVIWEQAYGPIPPHRHIHHKNEVKTDNRLENLEMLTPAEHNRLHKMGHLRPMSDRHRAAIKKSWENRPRVFCSVEGCGKRQKAKGFCGTHYRRFCEYGDPLVVLKPWAIRAQRVCSVDGCDRKHKGYGFCEMHMRQFKKHGKVTEGST